ncbi:hypothetical protein KHP62_20460 [Rhodobacteraceae bacterium NNCM2]|nr:hypothetical protein [Coraliihabitans acroporae]
MTIEQLTAWFAWICIVNFGLLALAASVVVFAQDWLASMHERMFGMERADLRRFYFGYLAFYKIMILTFALAPFLALLIIG